MEVTEYVKRLVLDEMGLHLEVGREPVEGARGREPKAEEGDAEGKDSWHSNRLQKRYFLLGNRTFGGHTAVLVFPE